MNWRRVVCFGDSITFGEHVPTSARWTTRLAEANPAWNVLTRGVCADTTRLALERFTQDVEAASPNVVVVQFGHNDCNRWGSMPRVSLRAYAANLAETVEKARAAGATRVIVCTPHRTRYGDEYEQRLETYAAAARAIEDAGVADAHAREDLWPLGTLDDGLHLSEWGHLKMAELIEQAI